MRRKLTLGITLAVGFFVGGAFALSPIRPVGALTEVHLTQTRVVTDDQVLRDTHFVWDGPAGQPMIKLFGSHHAKLENLILAAGTARPSAVIQLHNDNNRQGTFQNSISDVRIGTNVGYNNRTMDYGILITGNVTGPSSVNGDSNLFENISIFGMAKAGVWLNGTQYVGNHFSNLFLFHNPVGFHSEGMYVIGENWGFSTSSVTDIELVTGAGLNLRGYYSEASKRMAVYTPGPSGGTLAVSSGYWQRGPNAVSIAEGFIYDTGNKCGCAEAIRPEDFFATQSPGEKIVGIPVDKKFLSNVYHIT
jgi:hypothetical protein